MSDLAVRNIYSRLKNCSLSCLAVCEWHLKNVYSGPCLNKQCTTTLICCCNLFITKREKLITIKSCYSRARSDWKVSCAESHYNMPLTPLIQVKILALREKQRGCASFWDFCWSQFSSKSLTSLSHKSNCQQNCGSALALQIVSRILSTYYLTYVLQGYS